MRIRSVQEIQSLDDDLKLFDEDSWDFLSVIDNKEENYEYFNDIRDTDFDKKSNLSEIRLILLNSLFVTVMIVGVMILVRVTGVFNFKDYKDTASILSVNDSTSVANYVQGEDATSEDLIAVSKVLSTYFQILQSESSYEDLYDLCTTTSVLADTYYSSTSKIKVLYDTNDCFARAIREFGGFYNLNKINRVIVKDGIYYCYMDVSSPSTTDIQEFVHLYSYNTTKHFMKEEVNEASVIQYLLELMKDNKMGITSGEYCIKLRVDSEGNFKIIDDTILLNMCIDSYTDSVNLMIGILGGNLTTTK